MCGIAFAQDIPCAQCHVEESKAQPFTAMAHAASRALDSEILVKHPLLRFSRGGYTYTIARDVSRVKYSVSAGGKSLVTDLVWAFGFGSMGQTYLYEYRGALYETQVSFYSALDGLDLTIGHRNPAEANLEVAAGRRVDKLEATRCFACHNTGTSPGVRCERCHQGAQQHARSIASGGKASVPAKLSRLTNEELSDFCGACHRTWQDVEANGPHDINNVRLQPYRLATSKCYNASSLDKRISCVSCHDPHKSLNTTASQYDGKCQSCHNASSTQGIKTCKVGQHECVSCHMPKIDFPGGHFQFTDHRIRIVRGSAYPG